MAKCQQGATEGMSCLYYSKSLPLNTYEWKHFKGLEM